MVIAKTLMSTFFTTCYTTLDTDYIWPSGFHGNFTKKLFSVLHFSIRSLKKNFESFVELYKLLSFKFSIRWCNGQNLSRNYFLLLEGYMKTKNNLGGGGGSYFCV